MIDGITTIDTEGNEYPSDESVLYCSLATKVDTCGTYLTRVPGGRPRQKPVGKGGNEPLTCLSGVLTRAFCILASEDDKGKRVVDASGEKIGIVADVRNGMAYIDSDPSLTNTIMSKLGWQTIDLLSEMPGVLEEIGLTRLPHFTVLRD